MSQEVVAALIGAVIGGGIAAGVAFWLHILQRKDADEDWHRNNQRDIDWRVEDFVIDVHSFARNPYIEQTRESTNMFGQLDVYQQTVFDFANANELFTKAEAYEARVADPVLKECISKLQQALRQANYDGRFAEGREATAHVYSQKFYKRIAELYGGPQRTIAEDFSAHTQGTSSTGSP